MPTTPVTRPTPPRIQTPDLGSPFLSEPATWKPIHHHDPISNLPTTPTHLSKSLHLKQSSSISSHPLQLKPSVLINSSSSPPPLTATPSSPPSQPTTSRPAHLTKLAHSEQTPPRRNTIPPSPAPLHPTTLAPQLNSTLNHPSSSSTPKPLSSIPPQSSVPLPSDHDDLPPSPSAPTMTPAQKIAREVRLSFSLTAPALPSLALKPLPEQASQSNSSSDSSTIIQAIMPASDPTSDLKQGLTPAQAVAHQARLMAANTIPVETSSNLPISPATLNHHHTNLTLSSDPSTSSPKLKLKKTPSKPNPKISVVSLTNPPVTNIPSEPAFRVISGRKGLPGDGKDNSAIVRPLDNALVRPSGFFFSPFTSGPWSS